MNALFCIRFNEYLATTAFWQQGWVTPPTPSVHVQSTREIYARSLFDIGNQSLPSKSGAQFECTHWTSLASTNGQTNKQTNSSAHTGPLMALVSHFSPIVSL